MKTLFDTSVIVASLVEAHPLHRRAFPWLKQAKEKDFELIVAGHTVAEVYAVLSTLPTKPRISPAVAWRLFHENIREGAGRRHYL
jgi:predicted nucleic acid-binding protein